MTMKQSMPIKLLFCLLLAVAVTGCSTIEEKRRIDYKSTKTLPRLEVPPDLAAPPPGVDTAAKVTAPAAGSATFSEYAGEQKARPTTPTGSGVLPEFTDIRLAREGQNRWLVVNAAPDALWPKVREFVLSNGLLIAKESSQSGVIETDWAENRANVGTSGQRVLAKWLSSLYSTGTRDKFRIRLDRGAEPGTTEIYLSHQGMEEVIAEGGGSAPVRTLWQPRPSSPEIETEMLRLLMTHLGVKQEQEQTQLAAHGGDKQQERAHLNRDNTGVSLSLQDSLDRAWRRVGLSLDRLGFTVEDRDRSKGVYYVRYLDPDKEAKKGGWFSGWFGKEAKKPDDQYQIYLKGGEAGTDVQVLDKGGAPEASKTRERILSLLYEQLK
jgi:outer membrane protein assembly factor BamC